MFFNLSDSRGKFYELRAIQCPNFWKIGCSKLYFRVRKIVYSISLKYAEDMVVFLYNIDRTQ